MNLWMTDHGGFYNRGCEAIVRTSVELLRESFDYIQLTLFSNDPVTDRTQLDGESIRVCDGRFKRFSLFRFHSALQRRGWPGTRLIRGIARCSRRSPDCVLSIGGDNFSLDYGFPHQQKRKAEFFLASKMPYVIWGASIGPFTADPASERIMSDFLKRATLITARESITVDHLRSIGVSRNVVRVWDPAFLLAPERFTGEAADFLAARDVLGLNLSALVARWFPNNDLHRLLDETQRFVTRILAEGLKVLLVPHVNKVGGPIVLNDHVFLQMLAERLEDRRDQVLLLNPDLSAQEIKWAISQCRFFIGARTHSTIASYSTGVPTIAVGYSQKSRGLCRDIFGSEDGLLPIGRFDAETLFDAWTQLKHNETSIRKTLKHKKPEMMRGARKNAEALCESLDV